MTKNVFVVPAARSVAQLGSDKAAGRCWSSQPKCWGCGHRRAAGTLPCSSADDCI